MTADPIDTDAIRRKGLTNDIAALCDEVDRLRAAIAAIPRHQAWVQRPTECWDCSKPWPCSTEQAHRLIAAVQPQGLSDGDHAAGPNTDRSCGEGPHDGHVAAQAGPEGTLPAAKDCPPGTCPSCDEDRLKDSGPPRCLP